MAHATPQNRTDEPPPLRIALGDDAPHPTRAAWVIETLAASWHCSPVLVDDATDADLAYGAVDATRARVSLPCDPDEWLQTRTPPDAALDPLAAGFWHLARVEELVAERDGDAAAFDEHGRFRADASAHRPDPARPGAVDEIAADLRDGLGLESARWPAGQRAAIALTHDIDLPWRWNPLGRRRAARSVRDDLRAGRITAALRTAAALAMSPIWRLRRDDPWCNLRAIGRLERAHGARSTSYLMCGHHTPHDPPAATYDAVRDRVIADVVGTGCVVGLHGSYSCIDEPGRVAAERELLAARVAAPVVDHRYHYLRHRPAAQWPELAAAGMRSDASLGYAEQPGMRHGWSHPMRAWSHADDAPLDLVVLPLAFMDATIEPRYLDLSCDDAREQILRPMLSLAVRDGAGWSVLWHNDKLCTAGARAFTRLYRQLLREATEADVWLTDSGSLADAWRARTALLEPVDRSMRQNRT